MKTTALCALILGLSAVWPCSAQAPQQPLTADAEVALAAFTALADSHISSLAGALQVLALGEEVRSGNWARMRASLAVAEKQAVPCTVWFAETSGDYFTVDIGKTDQNLKDRSYFPKVLAGEVSIGTTVVSKSTGRKSAIVAVPVMADGKVVGVLGASIFLDSLSEKLKQELALPDNLVFFALEDDGTTTLNSNPARVFIDPREAGSPSLAVATDEILMSDQGRVQYEFDGGARDVLYRRSPLTGWRMCLGVVRKP